MTSVTPSTERRSPTSPAPAAPRRTRTTVTLGPFLVALTDRDRRERRPTVLVALAYVAPDDEARAAGATRALQARLGQALAAVPVTGLREITESLYDALAQREWPGVGGDPVEHGIVVSQVAVSLLPRDLTSGRVRPVATVSVANPDVAA